MQSVLTTSNTMNSNATCKPSASKENNANSLIDSTMGNDSQLQIVEEQVFVISSTQKARVYHTDGQFFLQLTKHAEGNDDDDADAIGITLDRAQFGELLKLSTQLIALAKAVEKRGEKVNTAYELGDGLRASVNWRFSGAVDLRMFWTNKDGEMKPSKRGIFYTMAAFIKLVNVLNSFVA